MQPTIDQILSRVRATYGNAEMPDLSRVKRALRTETQQPLLDQLRSFLPIDEDTDPNDDVSFNYILRGLGHTWRLALSAVGPFALLVVADNPPNSSIVTENSDGDAARIIGLVIKSGFLLLDRETIRVQLPRVFPSLEPDGWTVYEALFTNSELPPG